MHPNASLDEIVAYLDDLLHVDRYREAEPDSNGLLFRAGAGVSKIACALNTSLTTIVGAAKAGAQVLIVHHPPWEGVDLHLRDEKLAALDAAAVSLYAAHAALDCAPEISTSAVLARQLDIDIERQFMDYCGGLAGVIGNFGGTFEELIRRAQQQLGVQVEAHQNAKSFGRVGVVAGGAGNTADVDAARALGCDTYITGEGSMFTRLFARECNMNLVFGTHYATEAPAVRALGERIADAARVPWEFIDESPDVF
jgi:putative NIF3 family GTP cyclohydrolase 1 type 2